MPEYTIESERMPAPYHARKLKCADFMSRAIVYCDGRITRVCYEQRVADAVERAESYATLRRGGATHAHAWWETASTLERQAMASRRNDHLPIPCEVQK